MKTYELLVVNTKKATYYFIDGKRVTKNRYEWIELICMHRFSNLRNTFINGVRRNYKTGKYIP